jgi:cyclic-di-AMP phosphodiesterase PgpH
VNGRPRGDRGSALGRTFEALHGEPDRSRGALLAHHGARILLLLGTAVVVFLLFPSARISDFAGLERGMVAPFDVIAEVSFQIPKTDEELARERGQAAAGVPPIYEYMPAAEDTVIVQIQEFFAAVDSVVGTTPTEMERQELREFLEDARITPPPGGIELMRSTRDRGQLRDMTVLAVRQLYPLGIVSAAEAPQPFVSVLKRGMGPADELVPGDSLYTPEQFRQLAQERLPEGMPAAAAELQRLILTRYFRPSLRFNEAETEAARARARATVDPVEATVLRGERIVGAAEQIGAREERRLRAYESALAQRGIETGVGRATAPAFGAVLYNVLVLTILAALLWFFRRGIYHDLRASALITALIIAVVIAASVIARAGLPPEAIPVTFAALIIAVLWDGRLALVVAFVLALLLAGQAPFMGVTTPFTVAVGGAAAAFSVNAAQRRSKTWLFISIIAVAYVLAAVTMGMLRSREVTEVIWSIGWGTGNAVVASLLALGFVPLLESATRITTDQTLLELADLNRPRLKRLSLEASGTYAHTVNVANLAEGACNAIGANGLLARVGAYYHDIGKLVKPQFFIENQPRGRNPHDKLKPQTSANIIRNHVKEGLRMADEDRLPQVIRQFIAEHHGTQSISFFYEKAKEADPGAEIDPADFRYPGPKPQTRETAVVMMADSVESAARAMTDPSGGRLEELVERIVSGKMATGQLDEAPITLREVEIVKKHIAKVLTGMYHQRIDYPSHPTAEVPEEAGA